MRQLKITKSITNRESQSLDKYLQDIGKEELIAAGTMFGKFTKTKKFKLNITCLDILAKYTKYKVWVKPNGE